MKVTIVVFVSLTIGSAGLRRRASIGDVKEDAENTSWQVDVNALRSLVTSLFVPETPIAFKLASRGPGANGGTRARPITMDALMDKPLSTSAAISIRDYDVWAGAEPLILEANWDIDMNERWALVGSNGCGKSTLLRAIAAAASGETTRDGKMHVLKRLNLGMLEQTAVSGSDSTVRGEVMSRMTEYQQAKAALDKAEEALALSDDVSEDLMNAFSSAQDRFDTVGGQAIEQQVAKVLMGLGFDQGEFDRPCSSFSGGWQMRIALARLLLSEPSLLMLDEPTNHLDAAARRWLGEYVGAYKGTVLVVSHDQPFVSAAANSIAEVSGGQLQLFRGMGHAKYLVERVERQKRALATVEAQEREKERLEGFIKRFGAKATKASQAKDRAKKLEKLEDRMAAAKKLIISKSAQPGLTLARVPKVGDPPLQLKGASLRHPQGSQDILTDVDLTLSRGMRLVVRGPNGAGKSTLLKALAGSLEPTNGERISDEWLRLGVFAQDLAQELPQDRLANEYVAEKAQEREPLIDQDRIRGVMGRLGLRGDKGIRRIGAMSGGEKARVALSVFCLTPCNVILLDEPSNHLDVESISALVEALDEYQGTIAVISHDRQFCEALRCSHVAYVADGKVTVEERALIPEDFNEVDTGVVNVDSSATDAASTPGGIGGETAPKPKVVKLSRDDYKASQKLQNKIERLEDKLEKVNGEMMEAGSDTDLLSELSNKAAELQAEVEELYEQ